MVLAAVGLGEILWSLLVIFLMVTYFMMLFTVLVDLFRDRETNSGIKVVWLIALLFLPFITLLIYVIARGDGMARRAAGQAAATQGTYDTYAPTTAPTNAADQISQAKALLDQGAISQEEFDLLKAKALA